MVVEDNRAVLMLFVATFGGDPSDNIRSPACMFDADEEADSAAAAAPAMFLASLSSPLLVDSSSSIESGLSPFGSILQQMPAIEMYLLSSDC
jgi:hypothetical protein